MGLLRWLDRIIRAITEATQAYHTEVVASLETETSYKERTAVTTRQHDIVNCDDSARAMKMQAVRQSELREWIVYNMEKTELAAPMGE